MRRRLAPLLLAAGIGLALPAAAGAHAVLVRSAPADGARLGGPPHEIHLWFSEGISSKFRSAVLLREDGSPVGGLRLRPGAGANELVLAMPRLPRGAYGVAWRVVAEADGHATSGATFFGVGVATAARGGQATPAPPRAEIGLRWLRFAFTSLLLGGLAFVLLVLPFARPWIEPRLVARAGRRVLRVAVAAGASALVLQLVVLARQTHAAAAAGDSSFAAALRDLTFGSRWGALWLAGIAALAATIAVARRLRALGAGLSAPATVAAALAPASLVAIDALGSHAASASHAAGPVAVEAIHLLSASLWVGGIAALTTALVPVRGLRPIETRAFASAVRRPFAALAGGSAAVAALTGLYSAGVQVTSVDALLTTGYGKTLLAKTGVVAIVCVLGAANFRALRRLGRHQRGHTLVAVEVAAGAGALLAAAVLTASAPARGPEFGPPRPVDAPTLAAQAQDVVLAVTLRPNRPGPNLVTVVAASSIRPAPAPIAAVRIGGSRLRHVGGDHWAGTVDLAAPGVASLPIRVGRGDTELPARVTWRVEAADPARPVRYSSRRISAFVNPLVVLLLALAAASAAAYTLRRRGPTLANPPREEHA